MRVNPAKTGPLAILAMFILFLAFACAAPMADKAKEASTEVPAEEFPRTVMILPFGNSTDDPAIASEVRKSFSNHFSSKPFNRIDLSVADEKSAQLEKTAGKSLFDLPVKELADSAGADGVIYGRVTDFKKVYAVAYSQIGVEAEVWMVNAKTGKELWRIKESARYHEGGVPLTPVGFVMTAVSTAVNLRDIQRVRVVNELGWKLNEKAPVPVGMRTAARPVIKNALSNAKEGPLGKGKVIKVAMEGEKGLAGLFDVGGFKRGVPMKEVRDGEYLGEYLIVPGDNVRDAPVVAYLRRPATGEESQWVDISGLMTIDTAPPGAVTSLRARAFTDRVELTWDGPVATDLSGYRVMRSLKPLSGYEEAGRAEEGRFTDKGISPATDYYYRVYAEDAAKNLSEDSPTVKASLRAREPQVLAGVIAFDRSLPADDYIVRGAVTVPKGVVLAISAGARLIFEKGGALKVMGRLNAEGSKDEWIEMGPGEAGVRWAGVDIENGEASISYVKAAGADTALRLVNAPASLSNVIVENCSTGISSSGVPSPVISSALVWHNDTGVMLEGSQARISGSEVAHNKTGLKSKGSSPSLKDNNIHSNGVNVEAADSAVEANGNWFGTTVYEEMRFIGDVRASSVLDAKYPDGRPVPPVRNPYALLSPEEKKARGAELSISAGKYFRERNFGKAAEQFEEMLKIEDNPTAYYYLALSYQGMDDNEKALRYLKKGAEKFPLDSNIMKSYALLLYQLGKEDEARGVMREALKLNPGDRQIKFILERLEGR